MKSRFTDVMKKKIAGERRSGVNWCHSMYVTGVNWCHSMYVTGMQYVVV